MVDYAAFQAISPTCFADCLSRDRVMDAGIRPLWPDIPRVAGPAFTVRCPAGDNLMLHAAIYRAPSGSVIVVESGDLNYALAGGNLCAIAQKRGIVAFILDGAIRDVAEARSMRFPVFARGVIPIPGGKEKLDLINAPIRCGGVEVTPGDVVVADEEGVIVVPGPRKTEIIEAAAVRTRKEADLTLEEWEEIHRQRITRILTEKGFVD